jgi:predicted nucleic acid-binding protein
MTKILIDTDVILDFFFDRDPYSDNAAKILSLCEEKVIIAYITPVILSNVYYLLRQTASHIKIIEHLTKLISITEVLQITKATIIQALNFDFKDFEDALQNFADLNKHDISIIITRNVKDYKTSSIAVMTPDSYLKLRKTGN